MKKSFFFILILMLLELVAFAQGDAGKSITVVIENFKSNDGKVQVGLYASSDKWLKDTYMGEITTIDNKSATCTFKNVPQGVYAVSIFHDENNNDKLDTGYFGIPSEPYASSMGAKGMFGPPKWNDAKFTVEGSDKEITIKF